MRKLNVPREVLHVATQLTDAGFEAYLIGGCVRDLLIDKCPKDWDLTTNATPEKIQAIFPESFYENTFGTVGIKTDSTDATLAIVEVTPYREEGKYSDARRPDEVRFADTIIEDLRRRDFTINAIAYEPLKEELVDLHQGIEDIGRKMLRTVGDPSGRFAEDALRMMRAVRLSAELGFTIENATLEGIAANSAHLSKISRERIRDEFVKILNTDSPMQALYIAQKVGLLAHIIPELEEGIGCSQNQAHAFDVFEHLLRSLQHAADKKWPLPVRLAALLHDIGKPRTRAHDAKKNDWSFHGHEVVGAKMAKKILQNLHFSKEITDEVVTLIRWHMFFSDPDEISLSAVRRTIANVGEGRIWDLLNLRICDRIGTGRPKEQPFRLRKYISMVEEALRDPISVSMLKIDGNRIMTIGGEKPSRRLGWVLHALLEEVLDDPAKNSEEYLEERALQLLALPENELSALGEAGKERRSEEDEKEVAALRKKHHVT
ncbi:MAG: HD domain-containing protein [Candidatus Pacebacteria bacterium]|nr:HD domain-containing protein [Candidatus Paceibacterota bacterium]